MFERSGLDEVNRLHVWKRLHQQHGTLCQQPLNTQPPTYHLLQHAVSSHTNM